MKEKNHKHIGKEVRLKNASISHFIGCGLEVGHLSPNQIWIPEHESPIEVSIFLFHVHVIATFDHSILSTMKRLQKTGR